MRRRYLIRVDAPHYVAGAVVERIDGEWKVTATAPILRWMFKRSVKDSFKYFKDKGYKYERIPIV